MKLKRRTSWDKIPSFVKKDIAFKSLSGTAISQIAKDHSCCKNTVYAQKARAKLAVNNAFDSNPEDVLFSIAVTSNFINQLIVALFTICKVSYRDIQYFIKSLFVYDISLGSVYNVINTSAAKAIEINNSYDLSPIKTAASDEMFRFGKPILTTIDLPSRYCTQLLKVNDRSSDTWAISIMLMKDQGFNPNAIVVDGAGGIAKGYKEVLPNARLRYDCFHILQDIIRAKYAIYKEIESHKKSKLNCERLALLVNAQTTFTTLMNWLHHDILQLAGCDPQTRLVLFNFILTELQNLSNVEVISKIRKSLELQRELLLDASNSLDNKFSQIAIKYNLTLDMVWQVCYLARYDYESIKYQLKSSLLEEVTGSCYEAVEDEVLKALEDTYRSSSIVENLNGRVGVYLQNNKNFNQPVLDLIRCYLNHKPFVRSHHQKLKNKSPAEIMNGKPHKPFLQLLGFEPVIKLAA